jgi:hypothetical protein
MAFQNNHAPYTAVDEYTGRYPVRARPPGGRLNDLSVSHGKSGLCGNFAWVRKALNRPKRRFSVWTGHQEGQHEECL